MFCESLEELQAIENVKGGELGLRSEKLESELMRQNWECSTTFNAEKKKKKSHRVYFHKAL